MMKKIGFLALMITSCLNACPTCVGKVTHKSPPFFSDNFYTPESQKPLNTVAVQDNQHKVETQADNDQNNTQDVE